MSSTRFELTTGVTEFQIWNYVTEQFTCISRPSLAHLAVSKNTEIKTCNKIIKLSEHFTNTLRTLFEHFISEPNICLYSVIHVESPNCLVRLRFQVLLAIQTTEFRLVHCIAVYSSNDDLSYEAISSFLCHHMLLH